MAGYYWRTQQTPQAVRILVWTTALITLIAACSQQLFVQLLGTRGPQDILGLSWAGINQYFYWEPITYLFVQEVSPDGISFFYLITLFVNMYILWLIGSILIERIGSTHFLTLYFSSGILAGLTTLLLMPVLGTYALITGPAAALLAICMLWIMYDPDSEMIFFFLFPIKAKWLFAGVLAAIGLLCISHLDFLSLILYFSGTLFGYLYGILVLNLHGPFPFLEKVDDVLLRFSHWIQRKFSTGNEKERRSKIVDINTGAPLQDDDAFVDAMLSKIIKNGEQSLSRSERRRMDEISARKAKRDE